MTVPIIVIISRALMFVLSVLKLMHWILLLH